MSNLLDRVREVSIKSAIRDIISDHIVNMVVHANGLSHELYKIGSVERSKVFDVFNSSVGDGVFDSIVENSGEDAYLGAYDLIKDIMPDIIDDEIIEEAVNSVTLSNRAAICDLANVHISDTIKADVLEILTDTIKNTPSLDTDLAPPPSDVNVIKAVGEDIPLTPLDSSVKDFNSTVMARVVDIKGPDKSVEAEDDSDKDIVDEGDYDYEKFEYANKESNKVLLGIVAEYALRHIKDEIRANIENNIESLLATAMKELPEDNECRVRIGNEIRANIKTALLNNLKSKIVSMVCSTILSDSKFVENLEGRLFPAILGAISGSIGAETLPKLKERVRTLVISSIRDMVDDEIIKDI